MFRSACRVLAFVLFLFYVIGSVRSEELSFELPDKEKMCFNEVVRQGTPCILEYQVIEGGNYDVDVIVKAPTGAILYNEQKRQYDRFEWSAESEGEFTFCFSNEFSTFTHKIIYFDFQAGEDERIKSKEDGSGPVTQLESTVASIHKSFKLTIDHQTHYRLKEAQDRSFAEDLNERVQYWSIGQTIIIFVAGIGQILILKSFFTDKRPSKAST
ncbi:hypothetical protein HELRODRAFT_185153 [Helobdella robusta]|uniref:GOLD domain-containing protein n=1 Tax=Helobdella robusta TaxID=6412 RepID=T1FMG3_HELRO|nr:hypothetical protein HELRODRAFT_185153 [Helobdella robusta]ESN92721.1 hypothetical protein HELRODRAFT_185153 [Helobdella robusta]